MKDTLYVNLFGSPGTGKSGTAGLVFGLLKSKHVNCEYVTEFAKELVWEKRFETLKDQLYVTGKQHHRMFRVNGQVDVVVTDSPLILGTIYNRRYNPAKTFQQKNFNNALEETVFACHQLYNNLDFFFNRVKPYNPKGRCQTEEESNEIAGVVKEALDEHAIKYIVMDADEDAANKVVEIILEKLKEDE